MPFVREGGKNNIDGIVYTGIYGVGSQQIHFDTKTSTYGRNGGQTIDLTHVKSIGSGGPTALQRLQTKSDGKYIYNNGYNIMYGRLSAGTIVNSAGTASGQDLLAVLIFVGK